MKKFLATLLFLLPLFGYALSVRTNHPQRYVVREGDTLWEIAGKFLQKPWEWPRLWRGNSQIKNPDHIYPGDVLEFHVSKGRPYLRWVGGGTIKIIPKPEKIYQSQPVAPLPLQEIRPFLTDSQIFETDLLANAPTVIAIQDEIIQGSTGNYFFVNGLHGQVNDEYTIYRDAGPYFAPQSRIKLGYGGEFIGHAQIVRAGEPATLRITDVAHGVVVGDKVCLTQQEPFRPDFFPHPPEMPIDGTIIDIKDGLDSTGNHNVVVIDQGRMQGLRPGDVLMIAKRGDVIVNPVGRNYIYLPNDHIGEMMVFRVFDQLSFGLIMHSIAPIHKLDLAVNP